MAVDGYLNFDTRISTKGFSKGVDSMNGMLKKLASTLAATFSTAAIIKFGKECLNVASDMQEVQNVVDTAFGEMAYKMEQFAETSVKLYGISRLAAKQTGSSFAAMASGMGLAAETAADMSISLTALSADMASFYNKKQEDVQIALSSVFTGETETLKRYGILITEINLQEYARQQGITKSIRNMTQQEKVMLRYNYVMQATALAQGDFARTSGSWANQTRILSEQWKEFMLIVGNALMQVALPAVKRLNDALSSLISYADGAYHALANFFNWQAIETNAAAGITTEIGAAVEEQNALTEAAKETANVLAGFDKINKLSSDFAPSGALEDSTSAGTARPNVVLGLDGAVEEAEAFSLKLGGVFDPLVNAWNEHGEPLIASIKRAFSGISSVFSGIGASFAEVWQNGTAQTAASTILQIFTDISDTIATISERFATAWNSGTGTSIVQGMADIFQTILDTIQRCSSATAEWSEGLDFAPLLTAVDGFLASLKPLADDVGGSLEWLHTHVLLPFADWATEDALPAALDVLSEALDGIEASISALKEDGRGEWLWDKFIKPLADWTGEIIVTGLEKLADALDRIGNWIKDNPNAAVNIGALSLAITGLYKAVTGGAIATAVTKIGAFLKGLATLNVTLGVVIAGIVGWGYTITELSKNWEDITDVFEESGGAFGFISGWLEYVREDVEEFLQFGDFGAWWYNLWSGFGEAIYDFVDNWKIGWEQLSEEWNTYWDMSAITSSEGMEDIKTFFTDGWANIKKAFTDAPKWAKNRMQDIKDGFANAPKWFSEKFQTGWTNIKTAFSADSVKTWFSDRNADIEKAFSGFDGFMSEKFGDGWENVKSVFADAGEHFKGIWEDITQAFADGDIGKWFSEQFRKGYDNVTGIFDELDGYFDGIWDDLSSGAKEGINFLLEKLNAFGDKIESLLNGVVDGLNGVFTIDIPAGVPIYGGTKFGLNMAHIDIPPIPRLATGTVVPANYGEFLAILGDNKREAEIVSPISAMEQAMRNVLTKHSGGDIHLNVNLDGKSVYKTVIRRNNESIRMTGKNPLNPKGGTT